MTAYLLDNCGVRTATTGTATTLALGAGIKYGFSRLQTFIEAGAVHGTRYAYKIQDGQRWEIADGVYDSTTNTIGRTTSKSFDGQSVSTSPLSLSGNAELVVVVKASDFATVADLTAAVAAAAAAASASAASASTASAAAVAAAASAAAVNPALFLTKAGGSTGGAMTGPLNFKRSTVASNATTSDIWSAGNQVDFTGTATVTNFPAAPQAGASRRLICAAACTFTNNANIAVQGGANFTAAAGDIVTIDAITTTTFRATIAKASGLPTIITPTGWQSITSGSFGTGTSVQLVSIPATFSELMIKGVGVSHNNAVAVTIDVACSVNNGSAYGAAGAIVPSFVGSLTKDFVAIFRHYTADKGAIECMSGATTASPDVSTGAAAGLVTAHTGGCNALKIIAGGGSNFDAGTYALFGRA